MPEKEEEKRTRNCPQYKAMYEQSLLDADALNAELSYVKGVLRAEVDYNRSLIELLQKKGGA